MIRRLLWVTVTVYVLTLAAVSAFSFLYTNPESPGTADVIVCLGGGVDENGVVGPSANARARTCADLFRAGVAPRVLFTGGNDHPGAPSGGQGMAEIAMAAGLPEPSIMVEHKSRSTLQNALFSAPAISNAETILIVTDAYHLPRSTLSFAAMGSWERRIWASERHRPNPIWGQDWDKPHREVLAIWFNVLRYAAWRGGLALGLEDIDHWLI